MQKIFARQRLRLGFIAGSLLLASFFFALSGCRQKPPPDEAAIRIRMTPDRTLGLDEQAAKYYPPEAQDLFHGMDGKIIDGKYTELELSEQEAVGRNAWMIWTGGNEAFWDWLARHGYGTIDLLKTLDDRRRGTNFAKGGFITEPGMRAPTEQETADAYGIRFARPIKADYGAYAVKAAEYGQAYGSSHLYSALMGLPNYGSSGSGENTDRYAANAKPPKIQTQSSAKAKEDLDGPYGDFAPPDPYIYGFSSGIVGLRLFPNPEFVGTAAKRFDAERYYNDPDYANDPGTIRPFRVGMACSFCHVGPHPLNPPKNKEYPKWENLSSTIGAQYLRVRESFGSELDDDNYFYHVLDSQMPGTIDTSLIASDNINNANTMNAVFGLGWRVRRAMHIPPEQLSPESAVYPGLWEGDYPKNLLPEDIYQARDQYEESVGPRAVPRVLVDGTDSVGSWVALARVYLNIGSYHQRWIQQHNTILGFRPQQPFKLADCENNSVYWHATKIRVDPMTAFFLKSTDPMKLRDARLLDDETKKWDYERLGSTIDAKSGPDAATETADAPDQGESTETTVAQVAAARESFSGEPWDPLLEPGRRVFARGCIACHSSIQPGNDPELEKKITHPDLPDVANRSRLQLSADDLWALTRGGSTLPKLYAIWADLVVEEEDFWRENFLSTDMRVPVTMVQTNSGRAMATNAMHGEIWEDFASLTYKELDSVGRVRFRDPFSQAYNSYQGRSGGPGYYRVPTLISAWATAPFFHNNALGDFNNDPSVRGRLDCYHDAMEKLLWPSQRTETGHDRAALSELDRVSEKQAGLDGGLVWRTNKASHLLIRGHQVPGLTAGLLGVSPFVAGRLLPWSLPLLVLVFGLIFLAAPIIRRKLEKLADRFPRLHSAIWPLRFVLSLVLIGVSVLILVFVWKFRASISLVETSSGWAFPWLQAQLLIPSLVLFGSALLVIIDGFSLRHAIGRLTVFLGIVTLLLSVFVAMGAGRALAGYGGDIKIGPFPEGMPVNLVANLDPEAPPKKTAAAVKALTDHLAKWHAAPKDQRPGLAEFERDVAPLLQQASKCPDLVLDRGHDYKFIQQLTDDEKHWLIELVKTF